MTWVTNITACLFVNILIGRKLNLFLKVVLESRVLKFCNLMSTNSNKTLVKIAILLLKGLDECMCIVILVYGCVLLVLPR